MIEKKKPNGYWDSKENCREEAKKYKSRVAFSNNTAYEHSRKNGWLDEFFSE